MKTMTNNKSKLLYTFILVAMLVVTLGSAFNSFKYIYADGENGIQAADDTGGGSTNAALSNLENKATDTITNVQKTVVTIATAAAVLAEIIVIALIFFTHDSKKIAGYIKIAVGIFIALVVVLLINGGLFLNLARDFANSLGAK